MTIHYINIESCSSNFSFCGITWFKIRAWFIISSNSISWIFDRSRRIVRYFGKLIIPSCTICFPIISKYMYWITFCITRYLRLWISVFSIPPICSITANMSTFWIGTSTIYAENIIWIIRVFINFFKSRPIIILFYTTSISYCWKSIF